MSRIGKDIFSRLFISLNARWSKPKFASAAAADINQTNAVNLHSWMAPTEHDPRTVPTMGILWMAMPVHTTTSPPLSPAPKLGLIDPFLWWRILSLVIYPLEFSMTLAVNSASSPDQCSKLFLPACTPRAAHNWDQVETVQSNSKSFRQWRGFEQWIWILLSNS